MKTKLVSFVAIIVLFWSCDDDNPSPTKPIEPTVYEYVYTGKHEIKDFNVYIGPKGEKLNVKTEFARNFWGEHSLLGKPYYDTIVIHIVKDSLYMKNEYTTHDFLLRLSNDTLKCYANGVEYWGVFQNESTFIMNRAHYFINYKGRDLYDENGEVVESRGGHYGYWRYHEKARMEEFFHENSAFRSFADMTLKSDTIAWLTEYYEFKLINK